MKKLASLLVLVLTFQAAFCQYWQQQTNYTIDVSLNDQQHTLKGQLTVEYINNSPDKLDFIWFHLWPNAYKNENTAYAKQIFRDKEGKKRWQDMKDKGYIDSLDFTADGVKLKTEADKENIDILKVLLPKPLQPGEKTIIKTPFFVKIPTYSSRSGHMDQSYIICQWFPKPAVYDKKGWHPIPYLDQGEFYSEFGSFDVKITVPSAYVMGATGTLQNTDELNKYKELGTKNNNSSSKPAFYKSESKEPFKTLHYKADNVHDFAWFADKEFLVRYDTAKLASGNTIDVFTYSYENGNKNWAKSISYVEDAIRNYSAWIGEYPYPVAQAVEGPQNLASGGMEYPMITLITSPDADEARLDAVITHEVGHNWFYGILGSNERDHAWMDEGINTYYQFRYEAIKYKGNTIFGNDIPQEVRNKPVNEFQDAVYGVLAQIPMEDAIETPSPAFKDKDQYGLIIYVKTAIWMHILEAKIGMDDLDKTMQEYYKNWKFKHPYPEDLKAEFQKLGNSKFNSVWEMLDKTGGLN